jgi:endonuclease/exonuclease/phosphatase family metal-dependent hydrolase
MRSSTKITGVRMAAILAVLTAISPQAAAAAASPQLSVLTYNVEGLPWPARAGRDGKLEQIGAALRQLRARNAQPHVIVLQEAFSGAAKAIANQAGYRYIADGPSRDLRGAAATTDADRKFQADASMFSGETEGKWVDSGLRIASDYPILSVRRMAFPAFACAGYDCLANKGIVAVSVRIPGSPGPVAIVATHLNSRRASHASLSRSLYAYERQVDALGGFIRAIVPSSYPLVLAGDFNAGMRPDRRSYLVQSATGWRPRTSIAVALDSCLANAACDKGNMADIRFSYLRGRDWQFFSPGRLAGLHVSALSALFGHDAHGAMLSDHVGYMASYSLGGVGRMAEDMVIRVAAR